MSSIFKCASYGTDPIRHTRGSDFGVGFLWTQATHLSSFGQRAWWVSRDGAAAGGPVLAGSPVRPPLRRRPRCEGRPRTRPRCPQPPSSRRSPHSSPSSSSRSRKFPPGSRRALLPILAHLTPSAFGCPLAHCYDAFCLS